MSSNPRMAVLGAGGVGGLVGALAARAGIDVVILARPETADHLRHTGLRVRSEAFGDFTTPVRVDTALREPVDLCVVAVKQTALDASLERVPPEALDAGLLVPLVNGVEHMGVLRERYRPDGVLAGVIRVESFRAAPGEIVHRSPFADIDVASSSASLDAVPRAVALFERAGLRARGGASEEEILWRKLAFLAPFALLTTRHRAPIGTVRTTYRDELLAVLGETSAVSAACGGPGNADGALRLYDAFPPEAKSSMLRDLEAGHTLELDAIGGAVVRAAERHGVPVDATRAALSALA